MTKKMKSFFYRDWKYKIHWNERANPPMSSHMHQDYVTYKYLSRLGVFKLLRIRKASNLDLKRKCKLKKNICW